MRRDLADIRLSEVIGLIDGPLAPFGAADQLRTLIARDSGHRALYGVFLDVRGAAADILENTTIADIVRSKKVRLDIEQGSVHRQGRRRTLRVPVSFLSGPLKELLEYPAI